MGECMRTVVPPVARASTYRTEIEKEEKEWQEEKNRKNLKVNNETSKNWLNNIFNVQNNIIFLPPISLSIHPSLYLTGRPLPSLYLTGHY